MNKKFVALVALVVVEIFFAVIFAAKPYPIVENGAGFFLGFLHGFIISVTWIASMFTDNIVIYEVVNNGNGYNSGFFLGIIFGISNALERGIAFLKK